jgi:hypothetical protein
MEYKILEAGSKEALAREVSAHLAEGWTLQGGVFVLDQTAMVWRFFQAVVRTAGAKCD